MFIIPENSEIHKPDKNSQKIINNTKIREKILFKKDSDFHGIFVVKNNFGIFLKYKDTYQAGFIDTKNYKGNLPYINYFLIPYLINKNIEKILFMGLGSGIVLKEYEKIFKNLKLIDIVDIEENIFPIAKKYFGFKPSKIMNFHLQDAIIYLKTTKRKYDLIVVDVAGNIGIDNRFTEDEYLNLIKRHLKKKGIFISNLPSSRDIFNAENKFFLDTVEKYKNIFPYINLFSGETSNKIYYKTFFNIDKPVFDITNAIIFSSLEKQVISGDTSIFKTINIKEYLKDLIVIKQ